MYSGVGKNIGLNKQNLEAVVDVMVLLFLEEKKLKNRTSKKQK